MAVRRKIKAAAKKVVARRVAKRPISMTYKERIVGPIKKPMQFFSALKADLKTDFKFYLLISLISLVGIIILSFSPLMSIAYQPVLGSYVFLMGPVFWLIGILMSFVTAAWYHVWLKIFKAKGNYKETYAVGVYSSVPYAILLLLPAMILMSIGSMSLTPQAIALGTVSPASLAIYFVGAILAVVGAVWSLVLMITGFSRQHNISGGRAFAAWLIAVLVIAAILIAALYATGFMAAAAVV